MATGGEQGRARVRAVDPPADEGKSRRGYGPVRLERTISEHEIVIAGMRSTALGRPTSVRMACAARHSACDFARA